MNEYIETFKLIVYNTLFCLDSGQPPLKRQLLSEFDQTLDAKTSGLTPLKTCPNG